MDINSILLIAVNLILVGVTFLLYRATKRYADATESLASISEEQRQIIEYQTLATQEHVEVANNLLIIQQIKILGELSDLLDADVQVDEKAKFHEYVSITSEFMLLDPGDKTHFQEHIGEARIKLFRKIYDQLIKELDIASHAPHYEPDEPEDE